MSNFIERNNNWNAKREAKRECLKEKLAIKEMSEVKSPLLNKPYQDPKVKTSCDKQKSISKRSRRMLENHKLNASNVENHYRNDFNCLENRITNPLSLHNKYNSAMQNSHKPNLNCK